MKLPQTGIYVVREDTRTFYIHPRTAECILVENGRVIPPAELTDEQRAVMSVAIRSAGESVSPDSLPEPVAEIARSMLWMPDVPERADVLLGVSRLIRGIGRDRRELDPAAAEIMIDLPFTATWNPATGKWLDDPCESAGGFYVDRSQVCAQAASAVWNAIRRIRFSGTRFDPASLIIAVCWIGRDGKLSKLLSYNMMDGYSDRSVESRIQRLAQSVDTYCRWMNAAGGHITYSGQTQDGSPFKLIDPDGGHTPADSIREDVVRTLRKMVFAGADPDLIQLDVWWLEDESLRSSANPMHRFCLANY